MNTSGAIMSFRKQRATELESFARILEKLNLGKPHQIYEAATVLRDEKQGFHTPGSTDYSCWGYTIEDLKLYLPELPRHVNPSSIYSLEISIDIDLLSKCDIWSSLSDPLVNLGFRVTVRGIDAKGEYYFGYHIDKHNGSGSTDEVHPLYHLQYDAASKTGMGNLGGVLVLDTPRVMHAPVDLILGLDLVFSNFMPKTWDLLRNEPEYNALYRKYQDCIWKPYIHTWASHWAFKEGDISWEPLLVCPYLMN